MNIPAPRREGKGEAARHSASSRFIRREIAIEYDQSGHALPPSADQATRVTQWLSAAAGGLAPPGGQSEEIWIGMGNMAKMRSRGLVNRSD